MALTSPAVGDQVLLPLQQHRDVPQGAAQLQHAAAPVAAVQRLLVLRHGMTQGHMTSSQGHMTSSQGHKTSSQGHMTSSQGQHDIITGSHDVITGSHDITGSYDIITEGQHDIIREGHMHHHRVT